jgi:FkbM family methyltransferase
VDDAIPRVLVAVHRVLLHLPWLRRALASLVNRSVGERRVNAAVVELTRSGDCIWDVGANVGAYTSRFLDRAGPEGRVIAFEPVPANVEQLRRLAPAPRLTVVPAALGATNAELTLVVSGQDGETSHIGAGPGALTVDARRGDSLVEEGLPSPDIVKIDVEGFEGDVLDGAPVALHGARGVVIEVHFAALAERDRAAEPLRIVRRLRELGFAVRWLDSSHVLATR